MTVTVTYITQHNVISSNTDVEDGREETPRAESRRTSDQV